MFLSKYRITILILFFAVSIAIANQWQVFSQWKNTTHSELFAGIAHYFADYFLYTDIYAQGAKGNFFATEAHFTNEPMGTTWIYWLNALLGFLGNSVGFNPFVTYNIALFLFSIILVFIWYRISKLFFNSEEHKRLVFVFFVITASSFYSISSLFNNFTIEPLGQFWFSPTPAFNRLGGVPHQIFQTITLLFLITVLSQTFNETKIKSIHWFLGILGTLLVATANPIQGLILFLSYFICNSLFMIKTKIINKQYWFYVLVLGSMCAFLIYFTNASFNLPVLTAAKDWENNQKFIMPFGDFMLSVGPISILFLLGLFPTFQSFKPKYSIYYVYGFLSFFLYFSPVPQLFKTANVRWLHPASYGILGLIGTNGFFWISSQLTRLTKKPITNILSQAFLITFYLLFTVPVLHSQINSRANSSNDSILVSELNHIPSEVSEALLHLATVPKTTTPVVITDPKVPFDVLVPTLSGKVSFTGHPIHTLYSSVKENIRKEFFSQNITQERVIEIVRDHRIGFIVAKTSSPPSLSSFSMIRKEFSNKIITIYQVIL